MSEENVVAPAAGDENIEIRINEVMLGLVERIRPHVTEAEGQLVQIDPSAGGTAALGLVAWLMGQAAPVFLPAIKKRRGEVVTDLSVSDRIAVALAAARASESPQFVAEVRADLAALRGAKRLPRYAKSNGHVDEGVAA